MNKIAVFCPNLIGDTVMATPTFRALRRGFPQARLIGVIKPHVAPTLDGNAWFNDLIRFDPKSSNPTERTAALIGKLRAERCDAAILLPNSFRSALIAVLSGIPRRIGYDKSRRGLLLTERLQYATNASGERIPTPIVESYAALARRLGCVVDSLRLQLATTEADEAAADLAWARLSLGARPVVCLNTGGAFGPAKAWPEPHFATLARRLAEETAVDVLVLCGPSERAAADRIATLADHPAVHSLANQPLGIGLTKASVRRARLLITTDSGPRHFAAAFGTPVISLFGPTHMAWTRTYHTQAWHLSHPLPCGPCQKSHCPEGHHRCMRDLIPDDVFRAAARALGRTSRDRPAPARIDPPSPPQGTHPRHDSQTEESSSRSWRSEK
jgi:heptosyltransferase-2